MSKTIKLKKGLDIRLEGEAKKQTDLLDLPQTVAIKPSDFHGINPKLTVQVGDRVKAGTIIFYDNKNEEIKFVSPVCGTIKAIIRGEKRHIVFIIISVDSIQEYEIKAIRNIEEMNGEEIKSTLLENGLWPFIKQRPLDIIAQPLNEPKAIFISAFDSSPLAPDLNYIIDSQTAEFSLGLKAIQKLTKGTVHLTINDSKTIHPIFLNAEGIQINKIAGPHPAGNVGTQIHHIDPINKGEIVWTIHPQDIAIIGRFFNEGKFDAGKLVALTGSECISPKYYKTLIGANITEILKDNVKQEKLVRVISGNPLTGDKIDSDGYLGYYSNQITLLPEGNVNKFFLTKGWLGPGFEKFSISRLFPTYLSPKKHFRLDTNTNGEERAFIMTGEMEKVFPFDILPMQLIKATITEDVEGMENLGMFEVAPEDFALCEFVCSSKINIQDKIRKGLDLLEKEGM